MKRVFLAVSFFLFLVSVVTAQSPKAPAKPGPDVYPFAGLPPEKSAQVMTVPEGFEVKLFAGEPDVAQPIALCLDDRGRVWVAEAYSYPKRRADKDGIDRIVIFEDTKGTGKFDKRTVFMDGLNLVSGLEVGFGGVWIGAAPYLMFVPMKPGEDKPSGPPQILLDGWGYQDTHETLNNFIWGPDGWLYGCHGVFTHSKVGKPGTPDKDRIPLNAGVWRYHPTRKVFEVFAHGMSNPWGLDFNDYGQAFCTACVIPHAFHIIQGSRIQLQAGSHFNPYTYGEIKTIADHLHWPGGDPWANLSKSGSFGGGHAHCGLMIYLGGAWPGEYRNQMFMGNLHGHRLNMDILNQKGSGYVASHGPDFLFANDSWAMPINMRYGPDGNVYLIDWYDKQTCHNNDVQIWDRSNGRVYKICYRGAKPVAGVDLSKKSDLELVKLQSNPNDWYVRHARRLLMERYNRPTISPGTWNARLALDPKLLAVTRDHDAKVRLRGMWVSHVVGALNKDRFLEFLRDPDPYVRGWSIQLALENSNSLGGEKKSYFQALAKSAHNDSSPVVRLYLASACQRLPLAERWGIAEGLLGHAEDADDHNLPLMYWYAVEPLAGVDPPRALALALNGKIPQIVPFMVKRLAATGEKDIIALLVGGLDKASDDAGRTIFLTAIRDALKVRRQVTMPVGWPKVFERLKASTDHKVREQSASLAALFGNPQPALDLLTDTKSDAETRALILTALTDAKYPTLAKPMQGFLGPKFEGTKLRGIALRGLAAYDDPNTPQAILAQYSGFSSAEKRDARNTLASRVNFARALLDGVGAKKVPVGDVSADIVRQIRNLKNADLDKRLAEVWGVVRDTPADRAKLMASYKKMLTAASIRGPDSSLGRAVFAKTCAQCHTMFGVGGKVGPELTGSNRANLDYLLNQIIDPSATIPKEYAATVIEMKDGRVLTGIVRSETSVALSVITANETLTLPRAEIDKLTPSKTSMMPDDLLVPLKEDEIRALVQYMKSPKQVPLLARPDNVKDFFSGKDLAGWDGDAKFWKVAGGEIVGTSPGLKKNEVLRSHMQAGSFRLTFKAKATGVASPLSIIMRGVIMANGDVEGPRIDLGQWAKPGQWNDCEIVAVGDEVRVLVNGQLTQTKAAAGPGRGIFALLLPTGPAMEVRFKELRLDLSPAQTP